MQDLLGAWLRVTAEAHPQVAVEAGERLLVRWREPQRHYHTADHLAAVLAVVDEYARYAEDPAVVRLAAWFHDAIYDPRRVDNEELSAQLAEAVLPGLAIPQGRITEVARLVRLTATHDPDPDDPNGALLSDADLAILAAAPARYRDYTEAIRREYAHVPPDAFRAGRAAVLEGLLGLPSLFHTPVLRDRWEGPARHNIIRELRSLHS